MKTIVQNTTNLSKYVFEDAAVVTLEAGQIVTPDFIIGDLNQDNATMFTGVTPPTDWAGNKYFFDGTSWTVNPDWVDPTAEDELEERRLMKAVV